MNKWLFTLLIAVAPIVFAAELKGVKMPDQETVAGKQLALNGMGIRLATIFNVKVYVSGLYLETKSSDPATILQSPEVKHVKMHFMRKVSASDIRKAWDDSYKKNCGANCEALKERLETFKSWSTDAKSGDIVSLNFLPDKLEFIVNGEKKGEIPGADFGRFVLETWLGKNPPNKELRDGMLGGKI